MTIAASLLPELEHESLATRRVLERLPADQLRWRPHPKSYSLGQLALHVARLPAEISGMAANNPLQLASVDFSLPDDHSKEQLLDVFERALEKGMAYVGSLDDATALETWRLLHGEIEVMAMSRIGLLRGLMFNHLYHHRGQLLVYLRLLDVPVPVVYGATADENPLRVLLEGGGGG